jgi:hypothetical protein
MFCYKNAFMFQRNVNENNVIIPINHMTQLCSLKQCRVTCTRKLPYLALIVLYEKNNKNNIEFITLERGPAGQAFTQPWNAD